MPNVYLIESKRKIPSGAEVTYYVLRWADACGKWATRSLGRSKKTGGKISKIDANRLRREKERELEKGIGRSKPSKLTLSKYIDLHAANQVGKRATTLGTYRNAMNIAIEAVGDVRLDQLNGTFAARVREHMAGRNIAHESKEPRYPAEATIRKTMVTLAAMLADAHRRGLIPANPMEHEQMGPTFARDKRIFSDTELGGMLDACPDAWWGCFVRLGAMCGLRKGEILNLRWEDVDTAKGVVHVRPRRAGTFRTDRGETMPVLPWTPKTKTSVRSVPLAPQVVESIDRLWQERLGNEDGPYLFLDDARVRMLDRRRGGKDLSSAELVNNIGRDFRVIQTAAAEALGVKDWRYGCPHDLRATFGTRAAARGVSMAELKSWMGHSSITTTSEYYVEVEAEATARLLQVWEHMP